MFETVILTEGNLADVAEKTGRMEVELQDELLTAREANQILCITYVAEKGTQDLQRSLDSYLKKSGLTFSEFVQLLKEDLERAAQERMRILSETLSPDIVLLTEANIDRYDLPTKMGMDRSDLMEMIEEDKSRGSTRTIRIKDPLQYMRARQERERETIFHKSREVE